MKKNILFCCYGLGIGGIERCLINLLNVLDTSRYEIDVLPMNPEWDLLPNLRANVTVLQPFDYVMNTTDTIKEFKNKKKGLNLYLRYIAYRVINKWGKKPWKLFKAPEKEYDVAIAYAHIGYVPYYVIDCIHAKKKYMWHHEGRYLKDVHYSLDKEYYPQFNALVAVSNDDRNVLVEAFPNLENHIKVLYNVLDREDIRKKSLEPCSFNYLPGVLKLATVGRLTHQKGPDLLLQIASNLKSMNIAFQWCWVGDGDLMEYFKSEIQRLGLTEVVIPVGNQTNPYPYMLQCDIYVQPSYYEAYCTTTLEAQVLTKPVITTDVCGMREQFCGEGDGIITDINVESILNAIITLAKNKEMRAKISCNLKEKMRGSDENLEAYYDLFDE